MFSEEFTSIRHHTEMLFSYEKMQLSATQIWDSLLVTSTQRLGRAQFRKLETVASRSSQCDHFCGSRFSSQVDCLRVARQH